MELHEAISTLQHLSSGDDGCLESSEKFELACLALAREWARIELADYKYDIAYRVKRPIDITVSVHVPTLPSGLGRAIARSKQSDGNSQCYFIECKYYGRTLGLEVLSKPYLMALRFRPICLVIASNRPPTEMAYEFGQWVSQQADGAVGIAYWNPIEENNSKDYEPDMFSTSVENNSLKYSQRFIQPFEIESWSLWRDTPFGRTPITRSDVANGIRIIDLQLDENVFFIATLRHRATRRERLVAHLVFGRGDETIKVPLTIESISTIGIKISATLLGRDFVPSYVYGGCILQISSNAGEDSITLGETFPAFVLPSGSIQLPDLRQGLAKEIYSSWEANQEQPILTVRGEGGIGKTYLCERLARLATDKGIHVARSSLTVETGIGFISEFLWLLLPSELRHEMKSLGDVAMTEDFLNCVLSRMPNALNDGACRAIAQLLLTERYPVENIEPTMQTIARLLVNTTKPLLFIASNCQRIAEAPARALRVLLAALEQEGWGNVRVILEYRDTEESIGDSWCAIMQWLNRTIGHRCHEIVVGPLEKVKLIQSLKEVMVSSDINEATTLIVEKAGGNPLYLSNLFRALSENRLLNTVAGTRTIVGQKFSLASLPAVRDFVTTLGDHVETLLCDRISFWHERTLTGARSGAIAIGLNAIFSNILSPSVLAELLQIPIREVELNLLSFKAAGILIRKGEDAFYYSHEFARSAALKWYESNSECRPVTVDAANVEVPAMYSFALIKGRLNAYLCRPKYAVEAFNAAAQLAAGDYVKMLPCYKEMSEQLALDADEKACLAYHASIEKTISVGYYLLSRPDIIGLNKAALLHLEHQGRALEMSVANSMRRIYNHGISSASLHLLDIKTYREHATSAIEHCSDELEMSQILNRIIKAAAITGEWSIGRDAGVLATSLQKNVNFEKDKALVNVLFGEMATLYAQFDLEAARRIVEIMLKRSDSERQRAHDLIVAGAVFLLQGDHDRCHNFLIDADSLMEKLGLQSLRTNSGIQHGVLALLQGRFHWAADLFKRCLLDSAWQDNVRDEIRSGNNLIVAFLACDNLTAARDIYERVLVLVRTVSSNCGENRLFHLMRQASQFAVRTLKTDNITEQERLLYPPPPVDHGGGFISIFLHNAQILNEWKPEMFVAPRICLTDNSVGGYRKLLLPLCSINVQISGRDIILKAVC